MWLLEGMLSLRVYPSHERSSHTRKSNRRNSKVKESIRERKWLLGETTCSSHLCAPSAEGVCTYTQRTAAIVRFILISPVLIWENDSEL